MACQIIGLMLFLSQLPRKAVQVDMLTPSDWPSLNITTTSAVEGDMLSPSDWPSLNISITSGVDINPSETTSTPDSSRICFSKTTFYIMAGLVGVAAVVLVLTMVACFCCSKKKVTVGSGSAESENSPLILSENVEQDQDSGQKSAVIQALKEQKEELEEHRNQLTQQLQRTEAEKAENRTNLLKVDNTPGLLQEKEELLNTRWKLDDQQRECEYFVLHVDQLVYKIDALLDIEKE